MFGKYLTILGKFILFITFLAGVTFVIWSIDDFGISFKQLEGSNSECTNRSLKCLDIQNKGHFLMDEMRYGSLLVFLIAGLLQAIMTIHDLLLQRNVKIV